MRLLAYMGHPAHYHNVKFLIAKLLELGHEVKVVARGKDVLFDLLEEESWEIVRLAPRSKGGMSGLIREVMKREKELWKVCKAFKPDVLIGTDIVITHVGNLMGKKSFILNEDDAAAVPMLARFGFRYATGVFSPNCCDISPYNRKKIGYEGYHELAYLHPDYFSPDRLKVQQLGDSYSLLRFSALDAHHDGGIEGINNAIAIQLVERLKEFGEVYITTERKLEPELEPYRITIEPNLIHHALAFANILVSDSQTMTAEAAVLGTPSVRCNDFVGLLGYLEELQHKYLLTLGVIPAEAHTIVDKVNEILDLSDRSIWDRRRQKMLEEKVDVTAFWLDKLLSEV